MNQFIILTHETDSIAINVSHIKWIKENNNVAVKGKTIIGIDFKDQTTIYVEEAPLDVINLMKGTSNQKSNSSALKGGNWG